MARRGARVCVVSGLRPWGVTVFSNARGVPMVSFGVHVDFHTPTLDLHLPFVTVQVGRNNWEGRRFVFHAAEPWNGHTDNCDHDRKWVCEEPGRHDEWADGDFRLCGCEP